MQPVNKIPLKEKNTHKQGRLGSKVPIKTGPAVGNTSGNRAKGGGITKPTRGKNM